MSAPEAAGSEQGRPASSVEGAEAWAMVEASPDGMILADGQGEILHANAQVEALFGYERSELVGKNVELLLPQRHREAHVAHRSGYRNGPRPRAMGSGLDLLAMRSDGSEFSVEVSLAPIQGPAGVRVVATVRDITDRLIADSLNQAVQHGIDAIQDGVFMFTADDLGFTYVNQGAIDQLGFSHRELLGMTPVEIKPEFSEASFRALLAPLLDGTVNSHVFTTVHRRKDGNEVPVEIVLEYPPANSEHQPRMLVALVRDISERLQIQGALEASEEAFRTAFDAAPVGIALVDFTDTVRRPISDCNKALCDLLGYSKAELMTKGFIDLTYGPDGAMSDAAAQEAAQGTRTRYSMEKRYVHADGHPIWVWVHSAVLADDEGNPTRGMVHVADLTARKKAEAERERARDTQSKLELLEDRERLAQDLHDLVIQRLFASGMALQSVLPLAQEPAVSERINRPTLRFEGDPEKLPGHVLEQMYPTLTEALTNVARHADATAVVITVSLQTDNVELRVSDNGIGATNAITYGHGLANIEARAQRVGGCSELANGADGGSPLVWTAAL